MIPRTLRRLTAGLLALAFAAAPSAVAQADAAVAARDDAAAAPPSDEPAAPPAVRIVELTIRADATEDPAPPNPFGPPKRNFRRQLMLLREVAADPDVAGVKLEVEGAPDFAHTIDLLDELAALKAAGKSIVCYAESLGQRELLVASLADLLVVPPSGMILLEGLTAESMYMKDLFAKLDVSFELVTMGDHKTAYEELGRSEMSAQQREMIEAILDEFYGQLVGAIAGHRGLGADAVEALFAQVAVEPEDAAAAGLIDAAVYRDEFEARVERLVGGEVAYVDDYGEKAGESLEKLMGNPFALMANLEKILKPSPPRAPKQPYVGIVYCTGVITSGESAADFQGNVSSMGSDTIVEALDAVADDEHCKAIVLRVNSPGGSALASDMIWRAIERAQARKPVIASMGYVAGSGGYWISMGCDAIVAQPSTITGSIGVVSLMPDLSRAVKRLGINVEVVARGPMGDRLSLLKHGPTEELRGVLVRLMQGVYDEFIAKVADGRGMEPDAVRAIAGGRVWTGRQAEELGLVDALGGLEDAIALACTMAGNLDPATTPLVEHPHAPSFLDQLEKSMGAMTAAPGRQALAALLAELGAEGYLPLIDALGSSRDALAPERIQCLLPLSITIR